jgi:hypothetical protein
MSKRNALRLLAMGFIAAAMVTGCGGSKKKTAQADDADPVAAALDGVDVQPIADEAPAAAPADANAYTGPTKVTVNLKVVNEKNPKGSYRMLDASGTAVIENGVLGEEVEVKQGSYTFEFKSPLVFGDPVYLSDVVDIAGEKMAVDQIFPAGQITLHTFQGKNENRCVPTAFTVFNLEDEKELTGKGKTCAPLIVETGHYEVRLAVSKNAIQPVEMRINREQVQTSKVKLEK